MTSQASRGEPSSWLDIVAACRRAIWERRPLVHHVTNEVSAEASANAVLALGGSAVMARDVGEVDSVVDQAAAVVLNLGTLTPDKARAMERAQRTAIRFGKPIVIDPVGAGAIAGRARLARRLMRGAGWIAVRLNAMELSGIMEVPLVSGRGVDADEREEDDVAPLVELAKQCAERYELVVAVTGPTDIVTDGERVVYVRSGHPWLTRITGAGCMASSVVGAALGAYHDRTRLFSIVEAVVAGLAIFGAAAEWAAEACGAVPGEAQGSSEAEAQASKAQEAETAAEAVAEAAELEGAAAQAAAEPEGDDGAPSEEAEAALRPLPPGPGTFRARLMDGLFHVDEDELARRVAVWEEGP